jgi:tungstate transport system substrate-binding protein
MKQACIPFFLVLIAIAGCQWRSSGKLEPITIATTTSTQDSGLLDVLVPMFKRATQIEARVVAVGSGQAMELGRRGDADLLLTHAPDGELAFISEGFGVERIPVMFNDFVLVGPNDDPAMIHGSASVTEALRRFSDQQWMFISRGDDSGTHQKEKSLWQETELEPEGEWYLKAGTGMAQTLRIASEKRAYTLSDRATYLAQRAGLDLVVVLEKDKLLNNPYSAIVVNPQKHPHVHHKSARRFAEFLIAPETQKIISEFGIEKYGQPLFFIEQPAVIR